MNLENEIFWSDSWWLERESAWFIGGGNGVLFRYDFKDGNCSEIAQIPASEKTQIRLCTGCVKYGTNIICIPDYEKFIWIFSLTNNSWEKINVGGLGNIRLSCTPYTVYQESIYMYSMELRQIIRFSLKEMTIVDYITISTDNEEIFSLGKFVGEKFIIFSQKYSDIYELNLENLSTERIKLPMPVNCQISTISYAENKFLLCGKKKELYLWDKVKRKLEIIKDFPKNFGEYDFEIKNDHILDCEKIEFKERTFSRIIKAGNYFWMIPYQTNKVLYFNVQLQKLNVFDIEEEDETAQSLEKNFMKNKFFVEYVRENRYIGLYSLKNEWMIEIDCVKLQYRLLPVKLDMAGFRFQNIYSEKYKIDRACFINALNKQEKNNLKEEKKGKTGEIIFKSLNINLG